ncbi:helix-turn-helix transcriptional regulator [Dialister pneumosintes]|jgi:AraC-type DNA-binding domain-containing proteins|uniref:HTH araC/xylS-type domain-containing protein n=1 Tax=Dialister pneumosintes TaxID=39950 RepID=A0A1B3WC60_9FIRM|nr:helix-turn-helix domain-containing protein [Dialister pneumosintes]AOH38525.1 hypothetical protein BCB69_00040 [Dialister pneumosintes]MBS6480603.1 helix-turn-helix transcriptional regulator [Dialister sp.]
MIEIQRTDFLVDEAPNIKPFGHTYTINPKYGKGLYWTFDVSDNCVIHIHKIKFKEESLYQSDELIDKYTFAFYISGSGNEFFPYQNLTPHTLRTYKPKERYKVIYHPQIELICFSIGLSPFFIEKYVKLHHKKLALHLDSFLNIKNHFFIPKLNKILYEMYYYKDSSSPDVFFTAKIYEILSEISSYINKNKKTIVAHQQINKEDLLALQQISQYIDEHYNFDISLDMLAKIACMSVSKMKILFKRFYDMTTVEYMQRKRMSVAEHLLISTPLTIAEISNIVGYTNPSRFTEIFKRYYGCLPSTYRSTQN